MSLHVQEGEREHLSETVRVDHHSIPESSLRFADGSKNGL